MPTYRFEKLATRLLLHAGHDHSTTSETDEEVVVVGQADPTTDATISHHTDHGGDGDASPHPDDPVRQDEHLALLALVPHEQVTHRAVNDGAWSETTTWENGVIPADGAHVLIPENMSVVIDGEFTDRLATLRVDGALRFSTVVDTRLEVDTFIVAPDGLLEIGTASQPIAPDVTATIIFTDDGAIDTDWDPTLLSRGLISHGSVSIYGANKTAAVDFAVAPEAGDAELFLAAAVEGWQVGDRILVPGVVRPGENNKGVTLVDEDEIVTITSISADGMSITIDQPLAHDHVPPRDDLSLPVANLDRNVVFRSENTTDVSRAGHVMFMHSNDVSIDNAAFQHTGRNDKSIATTDPELDEDGNLVAGTGDNARGRYSVHFHRLGSDSDPVYVSGSVVEHSPGWGFVNHDSNVVMTENVSYHVKGAGFVAEIGSEKGAFISNYAFRSVGKNFYQPAAASDKGNFEGFGSAGHGFWLQSSQVALIDNVAAGHAQEGIFIHNRLVTEAGREDPAYVSLTGIEAGTPIDFAEGESDGVLRGEEIRPEEAPLAEIRGNQVFASGAGIGVRWRRPTDALADGSDGDVIEDFKIWNVAFAGIHVGYTEALTFRNGLILGDLDDPISLSNKEAADRETQTSEVQTALGKGFVANRNSRNLAFENLEVAGFTVGIQALSQGTTRLDSLQLQNVENLLIVTAQSTTQSDGMRGIYATDIVNVPLSAAALDGQTAYNVRMIKQIDRAGVAGGSSAAQELQGFTDTDEIYYNGHRLYFYDQAADAVPFPTDEAPNFMNQAAYRGYRDLTNEQLLEQFGMALGGAVAPTDAVDAMNSLGIEGLAVELAVTPAAPERVQFRFDASEMPSTWVLEDSEVEFVWGTQQLSPETTWRVYLVGSEGEQEISRSSLNNDYAFIRAAGQRDGWIDWHFEWQEVGLLPPWWNATVEPGDYSLVVSADNGPSAYLGRISIITADEAANTLAATDQAITEIDEPEPEVVVPTEPIRSITPDDDLEILEQALAKTTEESTPLPKVMTEAPITRVESSERNEYRVRLRM